jgi:hypothetical protein
MADNGKQYLSEIPGSLMMRHEPFLDLVLSATMVMTWGVGGGGRGGDGGLIGKTCEVGGFLLTKP